MKSATLYWMILALCLAFLGGWLCHDWMTPSQVTVEVATVQASTGSVEVTPTPTPEGEGTLLNINTATATELETLPSIGTVRAQSILDYIENNGPFTFPEEIIQVEGIGEGILEEILPYITTE